MNPMYVLKLHERILNVLVEKYKENPTIAFNSPNLYLAKVGILIHEIKKTGLERVTNVKFLKIANQYVWKHKLNTADLREAQKKQEKQQEREAKKAKKV